MAPRTKKRLVFTLVLAGLTFVGLWIAFFGRPSWMADPEDSFAWEAARYKMEVDR